MDKKSKKLSKTAMLYIFVALFITALSFFSATLAWYITTRESKINITFANPVVVDVTNNVTEISTLDGGNTNALKPGSKVSVNTGIKMGANSSNAYVRAKISLIADEMYDEKGNLIRWDNFVTVHNGSVAGGVTPILSSWEQVTFISEGVIENWWVCKSETGVARELKAGDPVAFYEGEIIISPKMDNRFAEKKIKIVCL